MLSSRVARRPESRKGNRMSKNAKGALAICGGSAVVLLAAGLLALGCNGEGAEEEPAAREAMPLGIERLAEDLDLDDAQLARVETIREILHEHRDSHVAEREEHFARLRAAVETGEVDDAEVHSRIDEKIEEIRALAHRVADEAIALVRSLEPEQRERAVERLDRIHERMQAFHEEMEAEGGPRGFFARLRARHCAGHGGPWPAFHEE